MTKFRTKKVGIKTINKEGAPAYKESTKLELISLLLTSFVKDKFYEGEQEQLDRLSGLVNGISDKKFVAKAAVYARTEFGMRSITHALTGELMKIVKGQAWLKNAIGKIIYRPDDALEILAYYIDRFGNRPVPNSFKKGARLALKKFDSYQLAKYRGENSSVKLVDLINLVHYKPAEKDQDTFKKLMAGELKSKNTWESKLSKAGQGTKTEEEKKENKKQAWNELIKENKLGYFALLRNLRNILEQAPDLEKEVVPMLTNRNAIKKSLVLPFRFLTAIKELENVDNSRKIIMALNDAIDISTDNVPKFPGRTLVALDVSGSMEGQPAEIGSLFAAVLLKSNDADLVLFSDGAKYKTVNPQDSTLTIARGISYASGGTNMNAVFELIVDKKKKYDRIIILSDMQNWVEGRTPVYNWNEYKKEMGIDPNIYSFDLNGYGTLQFPEDKVFCVAGWSEKILTVMGVLEKDRNALIGEIEKIEL